MIWFLVFLVSDLKSLRGDSQESYHYKDSQAEVYSIDESDINQHKIKTQKEWKTLQDQIALRTGLSTCSVKEGVGAATLMARAKRKIYFCENKNKKTKTKKKKQKLDPQSCEFLVDRITARCHLTEAQALEVISQSRFVKSKTPLMDKSFADLTDKELDRLDKEEE